MIASEFIKVYLKNSLIKGTLINEHKLIAVIIIGSFGHPIFAFLHLYVFEMYWDSVLLKIIAGLLCLSLATKKYWSPKFQPLFKYYWHFTLIYNLPFLITLTALNNHFIKTWFLWEAIMFYTILILVQQWLICLIDLLIGVGFAIIFHNLVGNEIFFEPSIILYNKNLDILLYSITFIFAIFSGLIFSCSNAKCLVKEERAKSNFKIKIKKILLVDDQEVNLIITKKKLEKIFPQISCDIARGGGEAIRMANQNKYQLILMDIQMPEIDGIEATNKIRMIDKKIPIIALTSLNKDLFLRAIDESIYQDNFNYYLNKSSKDNLFYRSVSKWMMDSQDDMSYVEADFLKILSNKKVILADDQQINRIIIKGTLESAGIIVKEAKNGKELLEIYQNSLDQNGKSNFDAIITDIVMPPYNGDEVAKEIRAIEALHKINNNEEIPIIAISGQGEKEDIYNLFKYQITDYFIKGSKPELLLRVIANYIN